MIKNTFLTVIRKLTEICKNAKAKIAFTGGIATNIWGRPRLTYDIDGIIKIDNSKLDVFLKYLRKSGFTCNKENSIKLIHNLPFLTTKYQDMFIDLFIARTEYQNEIFKRIKLIKYKNIKIPLVSIEDLILLKLISGRTRDDTVAEGKSVTLNDSEGSKNYILLQKMRPFLSLRVRFLTLSTTSDIEDIRDIFRFQKQIDFQYLKKWAKKLNVIIYLEDELQQLEQIRKGY